MQPDQPKPATDPRRQVIYVREDDQPLWAEFLAMTAAMGIPISVAVADAISQYRPFLAWKLGQERERAAAAA